MLLTLYYIELKRYIDDKQNETMKRIEDSSVRVKETKCSRLY